MKRYIRSDTLNEQLPDSWRERMDVARSHSTSAEILVKLSTDADEYIRRAVAENTSTPSTTLEKLSDDAAYLVRMGVAENPNTPSNILESLAHDSNEYVRRAVALNPNTPVKTLEYLAEDDNDYVRTYARKSLNKIDAHSKPSKPKRLSWPKLISQLRNEAEDGVDSLYEQTSAGDEITSLCTDVENKLGIWLEPSIQGGQGGIWFYSSEDDSTLASDYDYQTYNDNVISIALDSKNVTEFRNKYKSFVQSILDDPAYAPEVDE